MFEEILCRQQTTDSLAGHCQGPFCPPGARCQVPADRRNTMTWELWSVATKHFILDVNKLQQEYRVQSTEYRVQSTE